MCGKTTIWHLVSVERIEGAGHFVHDKGMGTTLQSNMPKVVPILGNNSSDFEFRQNSTFQKLAFLDFPSDRIKISYHGNST